MKRAYIRVHAFVTVTNEAEAGAIAQRVREAAERIIDLRYCEGLAAGAECEEESPRRALQREEAQRERALMDDVRRG